MEAPHGPSEDLQDAAVEGDHAVRPGSDFEQIHDGEGTRGQPGRRGRGRVRTARRPARLIRGCPDGFPLMPLSARPEMPIREG